MPSPDEIEYDGRPDPPALMFSRNWVTGITWCDTPWYPEIAIGQDFLDRAADESPDRVYQSDDYVTFRMDNGRATYRLVRQSSPGVWRARLVEATTR